MLHLQPQGRCLNEPDARRGSGQRRPSAPTAVALPAGASLQDLCEAFRATKMAFLDLQKMSLQPQAGVADAGPAACLAGDLTLVPSQMGAPSQASMPARVSGTGSVRDIVGTVGDSVGTVRVHRSVVMQRAFLHHFALDLCERAQCRVHGCVQVRKPCSPRAGGVPRQRAAHTAAAQLSRAQRVLPAHALRAAPGAELPRAHAAQRHRPRRDSPPHSPWNPRCKTLALSPISAVLDQSRRACSSAV